MMRKEDKSSDQSEGGRYNPVKRAEEVAQIVCRDDLKRYFRFRPASFYGGIATADCVGCYLRCIFCWSWPKVVNPGHYGRFYPPHKVAERLTAIARRKGFRQVRISGNEPTIGREHLLKVLEGIPKDILFILETNAILIGHDKTYAEALAKHENVYVRISFKGSNEEEFSVLTGAEAEGFRLQLRALENVSRANVYTRSAVTVSFSLLANIQALKRRLARIDKGFEDIEIEELVLYGDVEKRLKRCKLRYVTDMNLY